MFYELFEGTSVAAQRLGSSLFVLLLTSSSGMIELDGGFPPVIIPLAIARFLVVSVGGLLMGIFFALLCAFVTKYGAQCGAEMGGVGNGRSV